MAPAIENRRPNLGDSMWRPGISFMTAAYLAFLRRASAFWEVFLGKS